MARMRWATQRVPPRWHQEVILVLDNEGEVNCLCELSSLKRARIVDTFLMETATASLLFMLK